jgi:hypothetical protein
MEVAGLRLLLGEMVSNWPGLRVNISMMIFLVGVASGVHFEHDYMGAPYA